MLSMTSSPADSFIVEEVCPLCLQHYAAVDECTCIVCEAPSCPGCAELLDTSGAMRCYACAPMARATLLPGRREQASPMQDTAYAFRRWLGDLHGGSRWLKRSAKALYQRVLSKPAPLAGSVRRSRALDFAPR
jgi:hypothetical protein